METEGESRTYGGRSYIWHDDGSYGPGWYLETYLWGDGEGVNEFFSNFGYDPSVGSGGAPPIASNFGADANIARNKLPTSPSPFIGQTNDSECGAIVVLNALTQLNGGVSPMSLPQLSALMTSDLKDKIGKDGGGLRMEEITALLNLAASKLNLPFRAELKSGSDGEEMARDATRTGNLFISGASSGPNSNHVSLNIPTTSHLSTTGFDQVTNISSTQNGAVVTTGVWPGDLGSGMKNQGTIPSPQYFIIVINPKPTG